MNQKYLKPDFIVSIVVLIWFFIPGAALGWTKSGLSGFELALSPGRSSLILFIVPLSALYIIIGRVWGENSFTGYARRGLLTGVVLFLILTVLNTMSAGFFVALAGGAYLWWDTARKKK